MTYAVPVQRSLLALLRIWLPRLPKRSLMGMLLVYFVRQAIRVARRKHFCCQCWSPSRDATPLWLLRRHRGGDEKFYCQSCWMGFCGKVPQRSFLRVPAPVCPRIMGKLAQRVIVSDKEFPSGHSVMAEAYRKNANYLKRSGAVIINGLDAFAPEAELHRMGLANRDVGVVIWGSPHGRLTDGGTGTPQGIDMMSNASYTRFAFEELMATFPDSVVLVPFPMKYGSAHVDGLSHGRMVKTLRIRGYEPLTSTPFGYSPICLETEVACACGGEVVERNGEISIAETIRLHEKKATLFLGEMCCYLSVSVVSALTK